MRRTTIVLVKAERLRTPDDSLKRTSGAADGAIEEVDG
mgnify:CR=1 FL=1